MLMSSPEVAALMQTLQPTLPLFQIIEGYQDIQSVQAVLEAQESFAMEQNLGRFKQDEPLVFPEEHERIRYLGFFLSKDLNWARSLKIQLQFSSLYAYYPLILMLRSFGLQGKRQIRLTQGLTLNGEAVVNIAGLASFEFEPLGETLKHPERITGFFVYLIRPPAEKQVPDPEPEIEAEPEPGIVRASPGLNVYRTIDTRV